KELLSQSAEPAKLQILVLTGIYIGLSAMISIKLTHSLIGPTVAFRRHIKMIADGKYDYKTVLRSGDAFREVAEDLNALSDELYRKHGAQK
ncbi:MAG: hypothetical protein NTV34_20365, partial [Proteobacteria bacterium]|nr:hypothetical protein [Pseudomonadota bacterium]